MKSIFLILTLLMMQSSDNTNGVIREQKYYYDSVIATSVSKIILKNTKPRAIEEKCRLVRKGESVYAMMYDDTLLFEMNTKDYRVRRINSQLDTMSEQDAIEYGAIVFRQCKVWDSLPQLFATPALGGWLVSKRIFDFRSKDGGPSILLDKYNYRLIEFGGK